MNAAFGRYRLLERLGQGGMAEVFKAKSYGVEGFEKVLVIKRILPELAESQDFVDMFIDEAKLAVRLSHANIVQVFDLGRAPAGDIESTPPREAYYIAMEYVHGLDLASLLARSRRHSVPLPIPMGVYIASEVAKGLDHAHRRRDEQMRPLGIVHRDVSPQNVLLSFEGEVKVTDFGIAKARGAIAPGSHEDTGAKKLRGKSGYMSPEQARGEAVDARSDLFSLGAILYECVAGVNPFGAPSVLETLRRARACEHPPIELLRPDTPPDLAAILKTAMAPRPADRYQDAGRMYEALLALLYAQGSRCGAHDLAELLSRLRTLDGGGGASPVSFAPEPLLDVDGVHTNTAQTPTELRALCPESNAREGLGSGRPAALDRVAEMGERREVTALVLELARQAPVAAVDKAAAVIERWGGRVLRREAGHLAALFGLGDPDGRDTEVATRCALVAMRRLDASERAGAGLHTARVHVTPDGDPANDDLLASLLDTSCRLARAREGATAISAQAARQVRSLFALEAVVGGDRSTLGTPAMIVKDVRGPAESFGRFVGRKDELRRIGETLAIATKRRARVLTVRGDHGVGKTRLFYEVERRLRRGGYGGGFHLATCPPRGRDFALSGIGCMLQALCGTSEGDSQDRILAVQPRLRALGLQADEVNSVLAALGAEVSTSADDPRELMRGAFARMVRSLCDDRPHTLAWDAAHAMDEDSFAVLDDALRGLANARVVVMLAGRAGFQHPLETCGGHLALELRDLVSPDVERLVAYRFGIDAVPDELMRLVRARAGGNPLFLEEVVKGLVDGGAVSIADRRVTSMRLEGQELALPKTLRGFVASRIARLSREQRAALQMAAILGDPIDVLVLSNALGQAMPALERTIAALAHHGFVARTGPSEVRFASPLIPEIVVDALTPAAAREMHAAAGQAIETTLGERALEQASRVARHLYEAGDRERAAAYFAKSGERRLEMRQLEAAARDYAQAIALTDAAQRAPGDLAEWLERLATAVRMVRSSPDAAGICARVVERVDEAGGRQLRVRARVAAGQLLASIQHLEAARERLSEAEAIAAGDERLAKPVLLAGAELAIRQGDFKRGLELLDALRRLLHAASDLHDRHRVALYLAQCYSGLGDRRTSLEHLHEAEQLLPDDRTASAERNKVHALLDYFTRDFRSAAIHFQKAIDVGREMGLGYEVLLNLHNLGDTLVHLDDLPRAYGAIRQSLALCEESGQVRLANYNRMFLAFFDGIQGAVESEKLLRQGIAYAESMDFTWDVIGGRLLLARLLHKLGSGGAARDEYERTRALALNAGHRFVVDDCDLALQRLGPIASAAPQ